MPRFAYLAVAGAHVHVDCGARDWGDYDVDSHIAYHRLVLSQAPRLFSVYVDATDIPYAASTHALFFRALCSMARKDFKDRVVSVTVRNAPAFVKALYRAFVCIGLVPGATARKVTFVDRRRSKHT